MDRIARIMGHLALGKDACVKHNLFFFRGEQDFLFKIKIQKNFLCFTRGKLQANAKKKKMSASIDPKNFTREQLLELVHARIAYSPAESTILDRMNKSKLALILATANRGQAATTAEGDQSADVLERLRGHFPFIVMGRDSRPSDREETHAQIKEVKQMLEEVGRRIEPTNLLLEFDPQRKWSMDEETIAPRLPLPPTVRWPYFFALAQQESLIEKEKRKMMPYNQQLFMQGFAPDNPALLKLWLRTANSVFSRVKDSASVRSMLVEWSSHGYIRIRGVLATHPLVDQLTDLVSLAPLIEQGLLLDEPNWRLYSRCFMPGPNRVGVPLPSGLVLFEGRTGSEASSILEQRVRRAPFSTSWHINEALQFADPSTEFRVATDVLFKRKNVLMAHKIMSSEILGVDVQQARMQPRGAAAAASSSSSEAPLTVRAPQWDECEIIIQPLVSVHLVNDVVIAIDRRNRHPLNHDIASTQPVLQRLLFIHAFLGDTCPCGGR